MGLGLERMFWEEMLWRERRVFGLELVISARWRLD